MTPYFGLLFDRELLIEGGFMIKNRKLSLKLFVMLVWLLLSGQPSFGFNIELLDVTHGGNGCPPGTLSVQFDPSGRSFTLLYNQLIGQVSPQVLQDRVNCEVVLKVTKPKLAGFKVVEADVRGFVALDIGVVARHSSVVQVGTLRHLRELTSEFANDVWAGPMNERFITRVKDSSSLKKDSAYCVPFGQTTTEIRVKTQIELRHRGGNRYGHLTVDSLDGQFTQKYYLKWASCFNGDWNH